MLLFFLFDKRIWLPLFLYFDKFLCWIWQTLKPRLIFINSWNFLIPKISFQHTQLALLGKERIFHLQFPIRQYQLPPKPTFNSIFEVFLIPDVNLHLSYSKISEMSICKFTPNLNWHRNPCRIADAPSVKLQLVLAKWLFHFPPCSLSVNYTNIIEGNTPEIHQTPSSAIADGLSAAAQPVPQPAFPRNLRHFRRHPPPLCRHLFPRAFPCRERSHPPQQGTSNFEKKGLLYWVLLCF